MEYKHKKENKEKKSKLENRKTEEKIKTKPDSSRILLKLIIKERHMQFTNTEKEKLSPHTC